MLDTQPHTLSRHEWAEIVALPAVRELWALSDETPGAFAGSVYGVKFHFVSGSPGYVGDLFILQGDALTEVPPVVLTRDADGFLRIHE